MLQFEKISADIAKSPVLRGIQANLPQGCICAVVGRNGAGKTTLLRAIMGFVPLHQGRILLDGTDLATVSAHNRARLGVGYAPQERVMFPSMTVEENLRLPCQVIGMSRAAVDERLQLTLDMVPQLRDMLPRSGAALSGGQGKMAALGRALMVGPRLILLDEPFQGLAPALATQYSDALKRLQERVPELCILVTESNGSLLKDVPDRILHIERGALLPDDVQTSSQTTPLPHFSAVEAYP